MTTISETDWHLAFHSRDSVTAARVELHAQAAQMRSTGPVVPAQSARDWMDNVGALAFADWTDRGPHRGPLLTGQANSGWELPDWALGVLARHAEGTIDGRDDFGPFRVRLHDGQVTWHHGQTIYPSDRAGMGGQTAPAQALTAAILALNTLRNPEATAGDQWDWLDSTADAHLDTLTRLRDWVDAQGEDLHLDSHTPGTAWTLDNDWRVVPPAPPPDLSEVPRLGISIEGITRTPDPHGGLGESWAVTGQLDVDGLVADFDYRCEDLGPSGLDQALTVTRDGVDQGYDGWTWGDPPPEGASPIACRVDGEWLVDVIREACVQKVWDARYDGERAAITALPGTHTTRALPDGPVPAARLAAPPASAPPAASATGAAAVQGTGGRR